MRLKEIFCYIVAAVIGSNITSGLFVLAFSCVFLTYFLVFTPEKFVFSTIIIWLAAAIVMILGMYLGIRSYRRKDIWYKIFRPNKWNVRISIILSSLTVLILLIISQRQTLLLSSTGFEPTAISLPIMIGSIIIYSIRFFPFSALAYYTYKNFRKKEFKKIRNKALILLVLLNVFFFVLSSMVFSVYSFHLTSEPCGIKIVGFTLDSASKEAGIDVGEIVIGVDGSELKTADDLSEYLDSIPSNSTVKLKTRDNSYEVQLRYNPSEKRYMIGIYSIQAYCPIY